MLKSVSQVGFYLFRKVREVYLLALKNETLWPCGMVIMLPSLLNSMPPIDPDNSVLLISFPELVSQNLSVLSSEHEISCFSFELKRTCLMPEVWPSKTTFGSSCCSRSNIRSFLSFEPVARYFEHDEKFTDFTMCLCANVASSSPDMAFQILAEKSALPVAALVASRFRSTPNQIRTLCNIKRLI